MQRLSPYRGVGRLHHVAGMLFGFFALSWILTGFLTLNPGGLLARQAAPDWTNALSGSFDAAALRDVIPNLVTLSQQTPLRIIRILPMGGHPYIVLTRNDGQIERRDISLTLAPLSKADLIHASQHTGHTIESTRLTKADAYYFSTRHIAQHFPVFRLTDTDRTRLYLDDRSGEPLLTVDHNTRGLRWIVYGPHDIDFLAWLRSPTARIVLIVPLLSGVALIFLTGSWIGLRRLTRRSGFVQSRSRL